MKTYIALYLIAACIFLPIDLLWIGVIAKDFYRSNMGALMADNPMSLRLPLQNKRGCSKSFDDGHF